MEKTVVKYVKGLPADASSWEKRRDKKYGRLVNEKHKWISITCIAHALALVPGDVSKLVGKQLVNTQEKHVEWVPVVQRYVRVAL